MSGRVSVAVAVSLAVVAIVPSAQAATRTVKGKTSQDRGAYVRVRDDNSVARVGLRYRADCRRPRYFIKAGIFWQDAAGDRGFERNGEQFSDGGRFTVRQRRIRLVVSSKMTGAPAEGGGWAGTFKVAVRVKNRRGRTIDGCKTGPQTWRVPAPPAE